VAGIQCFIDGDDSDSIDQSEGLAIILVNRFTLVGEYPIDDSLSLQDPTYEQYATAKNKPKALNSLFKKAVADLHFTRSDGTDVKTSAEFSRVMSCYGSNTKHSLLCLAVIAHANDALAEILRYISTNKDDRTKDITVDFTVGPERTALWEAIHRQNWDAADLLIAAGADLTKPQTNANCPFIEALQIPDSFDDHIRKWEDLRDADGKQLQILTKLIGLQKWSTEHSPDDKGKYLEFTLSKSPQDLVQKISTWATDHKYRAVEGLIVLPPEDGHSERQEPPPQEPPPQDGPVEVCHECMSSELLEKCAKCNKHFCGDHFLQHVCHP
jgi:hypothetical protein